MDPLFNFNMFMNVIIPVAMFVFGTFSNLIVFLVYIRKQLKKNPRNFFCILALNDILALFSSLSFNFANFGINFLFSSLFTCQFFHFIGYFFPAISTWLLMLINIERLVSFRYNKITWLFRFKFQATIVFFVYIWNLIVCSFIFYYTQITVQKSTGNSSKFYCEFDSFESTIILSSLDLINSTLFPFLIMIICSSNIINWLRKNRKRVVKNKAKQQRDRRFSTIIVCLSISFFVFNFPICVYNYIPTFDPIITFLISDFYYFQYIFNIFVYIFLNSQFRDEMLIMLKLKLERKNQN